MKKVDVETFPFEAAGNTEIYLMPEGFAVWLDEGEVYTNVPIRDMVDYLPRLSEACKRNLRGTLEIHMGILEDVQIAKADMPSRSVIGSSPQVHRLATYITNPQSNYDVLNELYQALGEYS